MKEHWFYRLIKFVTNYRGPAIPWKVGDMVIDDLTNELVEVVGLEWAMGKTVGPDGRHRNHMGSLGVWVSNPWLDGGRHPWEISDPLTDKEIIIWQPVLEKYRANLRGKQLPKT